METSHLPRPRIRCAVLAAASLALGLPGPVAAAVLSVTTLADIDAADGQCSLREAIVAANTDAPYRECPAGAGADEIEVVAPGAIVLVADLPTIGQALTLRGLGVAVSAIDAGGLHEVLHFVDGPTGNGELLRVEGLLLTGGSANRGGAIFVGRDRVLEVVECLLLDNQATVDGGAIYGDQAGSLHVAGSSLIGNSAANAGGGLGLLFGGTTTIVDSTLAANVAGTSGGGVWVHSSDDLLVRQSTVSANAAGVDGGGVSVTGTPVRLELSTVTGNAADTDGDGNGDGGGLSVAGSVDGVLLGTVLAANTDSAAAGLHCPDGFKKLGATVTSDGFNLVGANDCIEAGFPAGQPNVNGDLVGTSTAPIDPLLDRLADNGGPTFTHLPMSGSPVVDQGSCPGAAADQRGFGDPLTVLRVVDDPAVPNTADGCDIGSVEAGGVWVAGLVFQDGFETGDTSRWSSASP